MLYRVVREIWRGKVYLRGIIKIVKGRYVLDSGKYYFVVGKSYLDKIWGYF